jgi:hypothetical protein
MATPLGVFDKLPRELRDKIYRNSIIACGNAVCHTIKTPINENPQECLIRVPVFAGASKLIRGEFIEEYEKWAHHKIELTMFEGLNLYGINLYNAQKAHNLRFEITFMRPDIFHRLIAYNYVQDEIDSIEYIYKQFTEVESISFRFKVDHGSDEQILRSPYPSILMNNLRAALAWLPDRIEQDFEFEYRIPPGKFRVGYSKETGLWRDIDQSYALEA